jgi:hypothetical protein
LVPAGIIGIVTGFVLFLRERLGLLVMASLVVATAIVLDRFPEFTSDLLAHVMTRDQPHTGHNMGETR